MSEVKFRHGVSQGRLFAYGDEPPVEVFSSMPPQTFREAKEENVVWIDGEPAYLSGRNEYTLLDGEVAFMVDKNRELMWVRGSLAIRVDKDTYLAIKS